MLFVEFRFVAFFALVLAVAWSLRSNGARKAWLLVVSYAFYGAWDWRFLGLIVLSTVVDWIAGAGIHAARERPGRRRAWLALSLVVNLGLLLTYKYFDFFAESLNALLSWLGIGTSVPVLNLILPVGISFYTFQTLSYSLDIYFGKLEPAERPLDLALFVAFFPQLVAGPIVLAKEFLPQLVQRPTWSAVPVRWALVLFLVGFVKKSCLSDALSPFVDAVHAQPDAAGSLAAWTSAIAFSAQIYCDFSGYTDMAIACAALLGYALPRNFAAPYLTGSIGAFWAHWHITLGRWFREYLYVPLGGNRRGERRSLLNVLIVFVVSGLWHGAAWTYVIWGTLHGLIVVFERTRYGRPIMRLSPLGGILYVNLLWFFTMVIFRASTMRDSGVLMGAMIWPKESSAAAPAVPEWILPVLAAAFVVHALWHRFGLDVRWARLSPLPFAFSYGVAVAVALPWVSANPAPYIYFAF
ncbi:MAG: MBOAT family O-acyltransferase [Planctomycetota bacterium]